MTTVPALAATIRVLTNPGKRRAIRTDFPDVISLRGEGRSILHLMEEALEKQGIRLKEIDRINIAYPRKHPDVGRDYINRGAIVARIFRKKMLRVLPKIDWVLAGSIYETKPLGRSEDQSARHTLTVRQCFAVDPALQKQRFPFLDPQNKEKEFFILVDDVIEQGTTFANLMGFIEHNDGAVLLAGVASPILVENRFLAQQKPAVEAGSSILDPMIKGNRVPELAAAFARSANQKSGIFKARKHYGEMQCVVMFEKALNRHGHSLESLTNGECNRILETLDGRDYKNRCDFLSFVSILQKTPVSPKGWGF